MTFNELNYAQLIKMRIRYRNDPHALKVVANLIEILERVENFDHEENYAIKLVDNLSKGINKIDFNQKASKLNWFEKYPILNDILEIANQGNSLFLS